MNDSRGHPVDPLAIPKEVMSHSWRANLFAREVLAAGQLKIAAPQPGPEPWLPNEKINQIAS